MKIMVSACLAGENCKYNGGNNLNQTLNRIFSQMFGSSVELSKYDEEDASGAAAACTLTVYSSGFCL